MAEAVIQIDKKEWERLLQGIERRSRDIPEMLKSAFMVWGFQDIIDHFRRETGEGSKWQKRSPATQRLYRAIQLGRRKPPTGIAAGAFDPGNRILQLTGKLRNSLLPQSGSQSIKKRGRDAIMILSNVDYSGKHQEGDPEKHLPARPFMWISSKGMDRISQFVVDLWLKGK